MEKKDNIEERVKRAEVLHRSGCNCCQSVVLAYIDYLEGVTPEVAARMGSAFGRGVSGMKEICGCVSGMAMIAGLTGQAHQTAALANEFKEENGAIVCRTLLGLDGSGIQHKPCRDYVASAARIVGALFAETKREEV